ncbi:hypothetical protein KC968_00255 [Candidatus Saccharibacteria bacterium]|nr:hypothetical protein [Candidatus Saccharibacteria bacterium]
MENPKNQLADKLKEANNVLVTVSANPTVDQLSAAIGLTLFLTKLKKHATTVFSGQVPSTIDFLKPEETIETNTDSLRDFIISLDKNKADKIRYKVEDTMVKIFITPYRTSINDTDLVFSQGDFNVDVVVAIGIQKREDIDQAIMAHGRILHDAVVATVNIDSGSDLGTLNWSDQKASSLCEMVVGLTDLLKTNTLDGQMATAFLTGIVAETERFSNEKTTSTTMNASAKLMTAGANQQLVATKLKSAVPEQQATSPQQSPAEDAESETPKDAVMDDDGSLRINHPSSIPETDETQTDAPLKPVAPAASPAAPPSNLPEPWVPDSHVPAGSNIAAEAVSNESTNNTNPSASTEVGVPNTPNSQFGTSLVTEPPRFGGQLSAAADDSSNETNPLNLPSSTETPLLNHKPSPAQGAPVAPPATPAPINNGPPEPYTVFEPEAQKTSPEPKDLPPVLPKSAEPRSNPPIDFPKAVDSASLDLPTPPQLPAAPQPIAQAPQKPVSTGQPYVDMGNKTLDDIEKRVDSRHQDLDEPFKLPEQFVRTLDHTTLSGIEEKVDSPHTIQPKPEAPKATPDNEDYHKVAASQVAKAMSGTTLDKIEEKVDSPHLQDRQAQALEASEEIVEDKTLGLSYESHESEPAEQVDPPKEEPVSSEPVIDKSTSTPSVDALQQSVTEASSIVEDSKRPVAQTATTSEADKPGEEDTLEKQEKAREAVMRAINSGGDGRSALPPLAGIGTTGVMEVGHKDDSAQTATTTDPPAVPPPLKPVPHSGPSPNISIDPEDGSFVPLPPSLLPNSDELPVDATASGSDEASAPPEVPPPMMPPVAAPASSAKS